MKKVLVFSFLVCMVLCVACSGLPVSAVFGEEVETIAIGCGPVHGMTIKSDGTVSAWGYAATNQLNITQVTGVVTQVAGNWHTSLALLNDHTLWECGVDLSSLPVYNHPTPVMVLSGVKSIAPGGSDALHSTVLKNDGTVWTWGYNSCGELGDGTTTNRADPRKVETDSDNNPFYNVQAVVEGYFYTLALKNDGTVWAWGRINNQTRPTQVKNADGTPFNDVKYISAGRNINFAIKNNGTLWFWNWNGISTPTQINGLGLSNIKAVACADYRPIALTEDGKVYMWQMPVDPSFQEPATKVNGLPEVVTAIVSGRYFYMVLDNTGTAWAWGGTDNMFGQLGDGTTNPSNTPVKVIY